MENGIKKYGRLVIVILGMVVLAFLSTYPAFAGHFFAINNDGDIHLARLESIYQALKAGHLPSLINFIGFSHQGIAVNAMYPWPTLMIFVIPRFLFQSPMAGLAVGFFIMNLMAIVNIYLLMRRLSSKCLIVWFGVVLYQFNSYHFQVMYTRVAIGEAFGYAFLPLIFLGLYEVWLKKRSGILWLGLGMGLVANSHVLSLVMFTVVVIIVELIRLFRRESSWQEVLAIIQSGVLAILLSAYSLFNIATLMLSNRMVSPAPSIIPLDPNYGFTRMLSNTITETPNGAHMGIAIGLLMLVLLVSLFSVPQSDWQSWYLSALGILVIAQNWLPWIKMTNTSLQYLQFTMRLLTIVALLLTVGCVLFLKQVNWTSVPITILFGLFVITIGVGGLYQYHLQSNQNFNWARHKSDAKPAFNTTPEKAIWRHLTGKNYQQNVNQMTMADYHLKKTGAKGTPKITAQEKMELSATTQLNKTSIAFDDAQAKKFKETFVTDQKVGFKFHHFRAKQVKLPVVGYHKVNYQVFVNRKRVAYQRVDGQLRAKLPAGTSQIVISVANNSRHAGLLFFSLLIGGAMTVALFIKPKRLYESPGKHQQQYN
ncbi:YfhO family protein [Lactiplantibacillus nangangensis]|uniref:YfhO family protein n=1 Tax=Lactiplantibacillus nangangensis TaxID=2559917 RepID=A0ABW1SKI8_9LACO|nr:YfhO family protein [Lactiplantibacillus nangangensis]